MEERSRERFTMFRCVIHHQCNTERSGDGRKVQVMEERSRVLFTIFRCVIHHQCNTKRSGAERSGDGRKVQGTFYNVQVRYSSSV